MGGFVAAQTGSGWWWGTDTNSPQASGSWPNIYEPQNGSNWYGGYFAEVGGYWMARCGQGGRQVNWTNVALANDVYADSGSPNQPNGDGVMGTALYYFTGGPGADPNYNGTVSEATNWGIAEAQNALSEYINTGPNATTPALIMDIEGQNSQYYGAGWNDVDYSCSTTVKSYGMAYSLDDATFNGFWTYIWDYTNSNADFWPGVYISPAMFNYTFGSFALPENTLQWATEYETSSSSGPGPWCSGSTCAAWVGAQSGDMAFAWQYSTPSAGNPYGDFDAIDTQTFYQDTHCGRCN
jgi:hypothetical protein